MINWIKGLFNTETDDMGFPKMKAKGVSEPVYAMLKAWQEDKERFTFSFKVDSQLDHRNAEFFSTVVTDTKTGEYFKFLGRPTESYRHTVVVYTNYGSPPRKFAQDKICICNGITIFSYPSWLTMLEVEYLKAEMFPYYQKRVARYRDIIKYREQRKENTSRRNSQIAKDKERQRLMEVYK